MKDFITLTIRGDFPDLNTELNEAKRVCFVGKGNSRRRVPGLLYSQHKKKWTDQVIFQARSQYNGQVITDPCTFIFQWFLKDNRKDFDNRNFAQKYIFDGLVKAGVIKDDSWNYTKGGTIHIPALDHLDPRVQIIILPEFYIGQCVPLILKTYYESP